MVGTEKPREEIQAPDILEGEKKFETGSPFKEEGARKADLTDHVILSGAARFNVRKRAGATVFLEMQGTPAEC